MTKRIDSLPETPMFYVAERNANGQTLYVYDVGPHYIGWTIDVHEAVCSPYDVATAIIRRISVPNPNCEYSIIPAESINLNVDAQAPPRAEEPVQETDQSLYMFRCVHPSTRQEFYLCINDYQRPAWTSAVDKAVQRPIREIIALMHDMTSHLTPNSYGYSLVRVTPVNY